MGGRLVVWKGFHWVGSYKVIYLGYFDEIFWGRRMGVNSGHQIDFPGKFPMDLRWVIWKNFSWYIIWSGDWVTRQVFGL